MLCPVCLSYAAAALVDVVVVVVQGVISNLMRSQQLHFSDDIKYIPSIMPNIHEMAVSVLRVCWPPANICEMSFVRDTLRNSMLPTHTLLFA